MKKKSLYSMLVLIISLALLLSCSGKLTVKVTTQKAPGSPEPTAAVITLTSKINGSLPNGTVIMGYDVTVPLPLGVKAKSSTPPQTDEGVVTATGAATGSAIMATYQPYESFAAGPVPGQIRLALAKADGIGAGEFAKINCDITSGHVPTVSDFQAPKFTVSGFNTLTGSTVDLTGQVAITETITLIDGTSTPVLSSLEVLPTGLFLVPGGHYQLSANGKFSDNTSQDMTYSVSWSASDPSLVFVSTTGLVTVKSDATRGASVTITAKQGAVSGSATYPIAEHKLIRLEIAYPSTIVPPGSTTQFQAVGYYEDGTTDYNMNASVIWTSMDTSIATVSNSGMVTVNPNAPNQSSVTITVTQGSVKGTLDLFVDVNGPRY